MKIQLDTTAKTIKVEDKVNLLEFIDFVDMILGDELEGYSILTNTKIEYVYQYYPLYPNRWWNYPYYPYYDTNNVTYSSTTCDNGKAVKSNGYTVIGDTESKTIKINASSDEIYNKLEEKYKDLNGWKVEKV